MKLNIKDTFNKELPADTITENYVRQVSDCCFSYVDPTPCSSPAVIHTSSEMLEATGITEKEASSQEFLDIYSGNKIYKGSAPYAMCYGGHQFGSWAGQLGDGRAINLFEINHNNLQWALQLKGAGATPYARSADGLAVLRSSVREYLCSEAMHHLGVPTTRALSLVLTGDKVLRDVLYNGNQAYEKGAIVTRVAPSFIRFGNFQILAARKEIDNLKKLTDYTITHFFPELGKPGKETYLAFLQQVADRTIDLVVHWERVGFVHGVMNTDNMSVLGLTIDYGPYGWLEDYNPGWTPNTTDKGQKRYRFGNQWPIAFWNIYQLANAMYPLVQEVEPLENILNSLSNTYNEKRHTMMLSKLGISKSKNDNQNLIKDLEKLLTTTEMDMTLFFRKLSNFDGSNIEQFAATLGELSYRTYFYKYENDWKKWLVKYGKVVLAIKNPNRQAEMNAVNPKYVLRNYMAQLAIDAADMGDYSVINELFELLKNPYSEQPENEKWFVKRPDWAKHKVGCSMLSCSS